MFQSPKNEQVSIEQQLSGFEGLSKGSNAHNLHLHCATIKPCDPVPYVI